MKNRAKCKLCQSIIESFHRHDYVSCACGEIAVDGGNDYFRCAAKDWVNFIRINDDDSEVPIKIQESDTSSLKPDPEGISKPSKEELLDMLDEMVKNVEALPDHAKLTPINHYDFCSSLMLLSALFRCFSCKDDT